MYQINDLQKLRPLKRGSKDPVDYKFVPFRTFFDVEFDPRRKTQLVSGGNMKEDRDKNYHCGVVIIDTVRIYFFLGRLNGI